MEQHSTIHPIAEFRKSLGLSIADFATLIGVSSKGRISEFENGKAEPTVQQALRLEELSKGRLDAALLNADVAAARRSYNFGTGALACGGDLEFLGAHVDDLPPPVVDDRRRVQCAACDLTVTDAQAAACSFTDCPFVDRADDFESRAA